MTKCPFKVTEAGFVCLADRAVTHSVLKRLPYEHTVESWVRDCFPDAVYQSSDSATIVIPHADAEGILAIQGAKGLGKSKFIASTIAAMPESTTVLFITFQISLANASLRVLGPCAKLYSQHEGLLPPEGYPRLCVVINSLSRVEPGYDVVVVDELVSVVNSIASTQLIAPSLRTDILVHLHAILRSAKRVIVADAMLDAKCLRFLLSCCLDTATEGEEVAAATVATVPAVASVPKQLRVYDFTHRPHDDYRYVAHAVEDTWKRALRGFLEKGHRVVVACMTKAQAELLKEEYQSRCSTYCYTGDDTVLLSAQMREGVDEHWDKCQLLVYSPVITAGCSFERPHFDYAFFYGKCNLASARTAIQMLSRVRDISKKRVHVFLSQFGSNECALGYAPLFETEDDEDDDDENAQQTLRLCATTRTLKEHHLDLLKQLNEFRDREQLICKTAFPYYFWLFAVQSGAVITFEYEQSHSALLTSHEKNLRGVGVSDDLDGPCFVVKAEKHFAHAWDIRCDKEYNRYNGKLLQRAGALHADRAAELNFFSGVRVTKETLTKEPLGVGRLKDARSRAWAVLVAQRALVLATATGGKRRVLVTEPDSCQACVQPYVTAVFPPAAELATCQPPDLRIQAPLKPAFKGYFTFDVSDVHVNVAVEDAWLLAALDVSVRTSGTPMTAAALAVERPSELDAGCLKRISGAVEEAFGSFFIGAGEDADVTDACTEAWVGLNVTMGSGSGAAVADAVVVSRGVWNVLIFRASGCARWAYDFDVVKGLALMTRVPRRGLLKLLYMEAGQLVTVDASRWGSYTSLRYHLESKTCLQSNDTPPQVVFMYLHARGVDVLGADDDALSPFKTYATLRDAFIDPSLGIEDGCCKVVSWGFREHFNSEFEKRVCDLEYTLVCKLSTFNGDVIPIAAVSPELEDTVSSSGVHRLHMLYHSVLKKCSLMLFLNDCPPKCIEIYSIPSVAFLNLSSCTELHVF